MNKHNEGYRSGEHTWSMGVNQFSDGTRPATGGLCMRTMPLVVSEELSVIESPSDSIQVHVANDEEWEKYKLIFNKKYAPEDEHLK